MINWNVFFDNSSETDALCDFAYNKTGIQELVKWIYSSEAKKELKKFKSIPVSRSRKMTQKALYRRGYN